MGSVCSLVQRIGHRLCGDPRSEYGYMHIGSIGNLNTGVNYGTFNQNTFFQGYFEQFGSDTDGLERERANEQPHSGAFCHIPNPVPSTGPPWDQNEQWDNPTFSPPTVHPCDTGGACSASTILVDPPFHNGELSEQARPVPNQTEHGRPISPTPSINEHTPLTERSSPSVNARNRFCPAREWEDIQAEAKGIPGLKASLHPWTFATIMQNLPAAGPIVVIDTQVDRCDAFALLTGLDEPLHIPLPSFSLKKAKRYQDVLDAGGQHSIRAVGKYGSAADPRSVSNVLGRLWTEVVGPIIGALGFPKRTGSPFETLPRIWWCPTGPLSSLPLHAAGLYKRLKPKTILDYAISSYTPTITALCQIVKLVKADRPIDKTVSGLLLTAQPLAVAQLPIPGATQEVTAIHTNALDFGVRSLKLDADELTPDVCLELMERYSSIHIACHAEYHPGEPLRTQFLFHRGQLSLDKILKKSLDNADLAYLSACETCTWAYTTSEVDHFAGAMLQAGYRRVIAITGTVSDEDASRVANDFYQYLLAHRGEGNGSQFDGAMSAYALYYATQRLRQGLDDSDKSLLSWIPFVHFGY